MILGVAGYHHFRAFCGRRSRNPSFRFFYKFLRIKQGGILRDLFNLMIKMVSIYVTLLLIRDENSIVVLHMTLEKLILCM